MNEIKMVRLEQLSKINEKLKEISNSTIVLQQLQVVNDMNEIIKKIIAIIQEIDALLAPPKTKDTKLQEVLHGYTNKQDV